MKALGPLTVAAVLLGTTSAKANELPVIVAYEAPSECASSEAFHALLGAEIARTPNPDRPWRFSVTIHQDGDYVGTLKTESGVRELRAPTCDEVTAALALVIAMAQPELPAPVAPPVAIPVASPPPQAPQRDRVSEREHGPKNAWRMGVRPQLWTDGSGVGLVGGVIEGSVEVPWGFPKMQFGVGVGAMISPVMAVANVGGVGFPQPTLVMLGIVDMSACPVDLPFGSTGLTLLGCGDLALALTKGIQTNGDYGTGGYVGGGAHLRWQSPWMVYVDAHFEGLYGTRIEGVSALMDAGGSVGLRF